MPKSLGLIHHKSTWLYTFPYVENEIKGERFNLIVLRVSAHVPSLSQQNSKLFAEITAQGTNSVGRAMMPEGLPIYDARTSPDL